MTPSGGNLSSVVSVAGRRVSFCFVVVLFVCSLTCFCFLIRVDVANKWAVLPTS